MTDIKNFLKFILTKSGDAWFERFKNDQGNAMTFPTPSQVDDIMNQVLSLTG